MKKFLIQDSSSWRCLCAVSWKLWDWNHWRFAFHAVSFATLAVFTVHLYPCLAVWRRRGGRCGAVWSDGPGHAPNMGKSVDQPHEQRTERTEVSWPSWPTCLCCASREGHWASKLVGEVGRPADASPTGAIFTDLGAQSFALLALCGITDAGGRWEWPVWLDYESASVQLCQCAHLGITALMLQRLRAVLSGCSNGGLQPRSWALHVSKPTGWCRCESGLLRPCKGMDGLLHQTCRQYWSSIWLWQFLRRLHFFHVLERPWPHYSWQLCRHGDELRLVWAAESHDSDVREACRYVEETRIHILDACW